MELKNDPEFVLRERRKELACLNEAISLLGQTDRDSGDVYASLVGVIPNAFLFPSRAQAELTLGERAFRTDGFAVSGPFLRESVFSNGLAIGSLTVRYPDEDGVAANEADAPAFLAEERLLMGSLAQMVGCYQSKLDSERKLRETIGLLEGRGAKIEAILDALPDLLFVVAGDGTIIDYRAGSGEDLAMPPDVFINRKLADLFPSNLNDLFLSLIARVLAGEKTVSAEYAMGINGETRQYETRISRLDDRTVIALVNNITERVLSNERLARSEERYRSLIDSSDAMIVMVDAQGNMLFANAIAASFFGFTPDDAHGRTITDLFTPTQASAFLSAAGEIMASGTGRIFEQPLSSGEVKKWFRVSVQPVRGADGVAYAVMINAGDISAMKTVEQRLRRSERNYRSLFETAPYGYLIQRNGRIIECNEAAARMMGGTRDNLIGLSIADVSAEIQPNGRRSEEYAPELTALALEKGSCSFEWLDIRFDGTPFLTAVNLGIVEYDEERLVFATWRDITQERAAEEELRTFRSVSDQSNIGTAIVDMDGNLVYVNDEQARMHGRTKEELARKYLSVFHSGTQMVAVRAALERILTEGEVKALEIGHVRKDGTEFPTLMNVKLIRDNNGVPRFMTSTAMDISDLKRKDIEIRKLTVAIEQSSVALVVSDLDGIITYVNPAYTSITGYESGEIVGKKSNLVAVGVLPPELYHELKETVTGGKTWKGEWVNRRKNGESFTESVIISPIVDDNGKITSYLTVEEDISIKRQVEEARIARTIAEEASRAKTTFLSNMSHEIRTPLNAIIGFAQILARDETLGTRQREQVSTIARSGDHLIRLVNDILDFSRIESGKTTLDPSDFCVPELLEDLRSIFGSTASAKGLRFSCEWKDTIPRFVNADEKKIRQVLINVAGNAVKFTQSGGVTFRADCADSGTRTVLRFEIHDTGPGIPPEDLPAIFDSFQQSQSGREIGGTGLGLSISRQLTDLMGGTIRAESVMGKGSIFYVEIPVERAKETTVLAARGTKTELWHLKQGSPPVRILVTDDVEDNRSLLRTILETAGFEVREACDGFEALAQTRDWKPHAILLDLRMPRMDGFETARRLFEDPSTSGIPVIAVTASAFEEDKRIVSNAGFSGYLRKPFQQQEIFETLREKLGLEFEPPRIAPDSNVRTAALTADDLGDLDATTKADLLKALEQGNVSRFKALLIQIMPVSPELASILTEMASKYEYDRLRELLSGNKAGGEVN